MNTIIHGDCLDKLKELEENSVDAIVTDPPYGLSFMGKKWDYDVPSEEIWKECLRVLKPGGYLLSFAGTRTQHRMAVRIEDAGFEIRDMIAWIYGSGFPKSLNIGKVVDKLQGNEREVVGTTNSKGIRSGANNIVGDSYKCDGYDATKGTSEWEGWGTALKPALEPITVARKPLSEKTVAENCLKWGTGGINIDGSRVETDDKLSIHKGNLFHGNSGIDTRESFETASQSLGRFPANLIHDGSDEVVSLFPNTGKGNGGKPYNYAGVEYNNKNTSMFNGDKPQAPSNFNDSGSASRFFYCAKASKSERNKGCEELPLRNNMRVNAPRENEEEKVTEKSNNFHPTVKPLALMEYLVKLVSKEGAIVLDPFAGSGSTLLACKKLDRNYIGIEREADYIEIINKRLEI